MIGEARAVPAFDDHPAQVDARYAQPVDEHGNIRQNNTTTIGCIYQRGNS